MFVSYYQTLLCKIKYQTCRGGTMLRKFERITLIPYPTDLIFCYMFHVLYILLHTSG